MITEFQLSDAEGNIIGHGEIDNGIYRVFSAASLSGCEEFETVEEVLERYGAVALQPALFQTPAGTRQLGLFQEPERNDDKSETF